MADFCSENKDIITDSNYTQKFPGTSCLPGGTGFPSSAISSSGIINKSALDQHIKTLLDNQKAVAPLSIRQLQEMDPAADFAKSAAQLRASINTEYCFYYKRYIYILHVILTMAATETSARLTAADYVTKKNNTEGLNSRLNQILQIIQALVNSRLSSLRTYYGTDTGVNQANSYLDTTRRDLLNHSKLLKNKAMEKDLKSAMVDYTVEKNSSSRNLLAIYGFMNIVAAGLIFYLYRTSKN